MRINMVGAMFTVAIASAATFSLPCGDAMAASGDGRCKPARDAFRHAKPGRDKAKASVDVIDACGLGVGSSLSAFDAAFGTSFDARRRALPKASLDTVVLYFEPQHGNTDDSMASAYTGWYLAITYTGSGLVRDYALSNVHK